jgi:mono/diheme cytochrome c family protein
MSFSMLKLLWRISPLFLLLMLAACGSLAGDVEIVATLPPITIAPQEGFQLPQAAPDVANGQRIFQANCTRCHGANGDGDGELVATGEVPRMPSFQEPAHVRQQSLEYYYTTISDGNIANLMPPWSGSLSLQERWDVAAYVYTLHYSQEQVARGQTLVTNPSSAIRPESDNNLAAETGLTGEDAFAAVAYQRVQSFSNWSVNATVPVTPVPEATELPLPTFTSVDFFGTVTHGTAGKTVPPALHVQLRYGNAQTGVQVLDTVIDASNQYRFVAVPYDETYEYFVSTTYQERGFLSSLITGRTMQASNELNITLYDTIAEPSAVTMTRMDFRIDLLSVPDLGTGLIVSQINDYYNNTDRMFILRPEGSEYSVSLLMQLPIGATILNTPNDQRFIQAQSEYALIDLQPVYPGEHSINASYFLLYRDGRVIDIPSNNRFEGQVDILLSIPELSINSDTLRFIEEVNIGTEQNPQMAKHYSGTLALAPGESLVFDIEGELPISENTSRDSTIVTQEQVIPVFMVLGIVVLALAVGMLFGLRARATSPQGKINRLMKQIGQLEDLHKAGRINHDAFQQQIKGLKQELARVTAEQKKS